MLSHVTTKSLVGTALFGALATSAFGLYTRRSIQLEWAKQPFYQDAIKALRSHMIEHKPQLKEERVFTLY